MERDRDLKLCTKIDIYKIYRLVAFWKQNGCQWRHHDVIIAQKQQQLVFNHFFLLETQFHRIFSLQSIELRPENNFLYIFLLFNYLFLVFISFFTFSWHIFMPEYNILIEKIENHNFRFKKSFLMMHSLSKSKKKNSKLKILLSIFSYDVIHIDDVIVIKFCLRQWN